jgi:hypothetical protein
MTPEQLAHALAAILQNAVRDGLTITIDGSSINISGENGIKAGARNWYQLRQPFLDPEIHEAVPDHTGSFTWTRRR